MKDSHKKIKSLFYIVCIISMIITIMSKVSAEEISVSDLKGYYISQLDPNNLQAYDYDLLLDFDTFPYTFMLKSDYGVAIFMWKFDNYVLKAMNDGNVNSSYRWTTYMFGGSNDNDQIAFRNNWSRINDNSVGRVLIYDNSYSPSFIAADYFATDDPRINSSNTYFWSHGNSRQISNIPYNRGRVNQYVMSSVKPSDIYIPSDVTVHYCGYGTYISGGSYKGVITYDMPYVNKISFFAYDSNFSIYKTYGTGGISDPVLNIQYLDNLFSQGYIYTSDTTYTLTFDIDGSSVSVPISSNTYPDDFLENGLFRTSYDLIYRMLSNKILDFSSVENVTLTQVSLSAMAYPTADHQGTPETVTKSTLCNLVLKGSSGTDAESENISDITDQTIVFDQVAESGDFFNHTGIYHNDVVVPDWAETFIIVIDAYGVGVYTPPFNYDWYVGQEVFEQFSFEGYVDPEFININNAQVDYYNNLRLIKDNVVDCMTYLNLLQSCDVVRVMYGTMTPNGWDSASDYVFFMSSYYQKLTIKGIGNVQSAVESGTYYTKSLYWYLKERLDNMSGYLVPYINESKNNQIIQNGYLQSINTNVLNIKDSIESGVNSIVSAISGISGGSSSYSLPSLSTELQRLFIPSLTWQSIDFEEYMDSMGVLSLPFTFTNDVLTVADNSYSSTLDLHINDFALDVTGNNDVLTIFEDQDYSFNPRSIFANSAWTMLTYLNAFALILGEAWITYCHIFRREKSNDC